jgi:hypothetical protein
MSTLHKCLIAVPALGELCHTESILQESTSGKVCWLASAKTFLCDPSSSDSLLPIEPRGHRMILLQVLFKIPTPRDFNFEKYEQLLVCRPLSGLHRRADLAAPQVPEKIAGEKKVIDALAAAGFEVMWGGNADPGARRIIEALYPDSTFC